MWKEKLNPTKEMFIQRISTINHTTPTELRKVWPCHVYITCDMALDRILCYLKLFQSNFVLFNSLLVLCFAIKISRGHGILIERSSSLRKASHAE